MWLRVNFIMPELLSKDIAYFSLDQPCKLPGPNLGENQQTGPNIN